jgi:hypothetical protein
MTLMPAIKLYISIDQKTKVWLKLKAAEFKPLLILI